MHEETAITNLICIVSSDNRELGSIRQPMYVLCKATPHICTMHGPNIHITAFSVRPERERGDDDILGTGALIIDLVLDKWILRVGIRTHPPRPTGACGEAKGRGGEEEGVKVVDV